MRIIGLTGGIASGKSTVTAIFAELGARTLSADEDARAVLESDSPVLSAVLQTFPDAVGAEGGIDRARLAAMIFASPEARERLEEIMHPAITQRMRDAIRAARSDEEGGVLIYEVPLLFEAHLEALFDGVIVVMATTEQQHERLQGREKKAGRSPLSASKIAKRLTAQLPSGIKAARADFVIDNSGALDATQQQAQIIWKAITGG